MKINKKDFLIWIGGLYLIGIGFRMLYNQYLYYHGITILPYHFFNFFIDWIPMLVLGIILVYFSLKRMYRKIV